MPTAVAQAMPAQAPAERVEVQIQQMEDKFAAALPAHIPAARFVRVALSALANPSLAKAKESAAGRKSVFDACLRAASDGLLVDGREAALVLYGDKVQYMPMVAGLMKKARNSGEMASIVAQCVYSADTFQVDYVTDGPPIMHRPALAEDRGEFVCAYAVARLKDGTWTQPEVMTRGEIEAVRARSRAKNAGPWVTDWTEMARKTVIRRASKYWPSSTDKDGIAFQDVVSRDDELIDLTATEQALAIAAPKARGAGAKLLAQVSPPPAPASDHDPDTGEVIDAEATEADV